MYFINYIVSSHQITSPGYVVYLFMYSMGEGLVYLHSSKSAPIIYYIYMFQMELSALLLHERISTGYSQDKGT